MSAAPPSLLATKWDDGETLRGGGGGGEEGGGVRNQVGESAEQVVEEEDCRVADEIAKREG